MPESKKMSPWLVTTDPKQLRRLGKTAEELAELQKVIARVQIQGIDGVDPDSCVSNREAMQKEVADVAAQVELLIRHYNLDRTAMVARSTQKMQQMVEWEQVLEEKGSI